MKVMITGVAGFIGSTLAQRLLARGDSVYGVDNMNDYYDVTLKEARLKLFSGHKSFSFDKLDIVDRARRPLRRHRADHPERLEGRTMTDSNLQPEIVRGIASGQIFRPHP